MGRIIMLRLWHAQFLEPVRNRRTCPAVTPELCQANAHADNHTSFIFILLLSGTHIFELIRFTSDHHSIHKIQTAVICRRIRMHTQDAIHHVPRPARWCQTPWHCTWSGCDSPLRSSWQPNSKLISSLGEARRNVSRPTVGTWCL